MTRAPALFRLAGCASLMALAVTAAGAQADTLSEALVAAYKTNPTLESARAGQRAIDEGVPIQRAQGLPSLNITATETGLGFWNAPFASCICLGNCDAASAPL